MIDTDTALELIKSVAQTLPPLQLPLVESVGLRLAEDVTSDLDSPPHDKSLMDGYAIRAADFAPGVVLRILEEVTAGMTPTQALEPGCATRIMTGAPLPEGCDAVVMVEETVHVESTGETDENPLGQVRLTAQTVSAGQNLMPKATCLQNGQVVMKAGRLIRPQHVGLMAEVGHVAPHITPKPGVAILSTGNELVPLDETPQPGQIRNSNGPLLLSLVDRAGGVSLDLGIGSDDEAQLEKRIQQGLTRHVLLLSGGVSAGVLDLTPKVLQKCGVREIFHKVQLKPGKPLWFGIHEGDHPTLVFGLPGNPLSSLVCFELFVRPAIDILRGCTELTPTARMLKLTEPFQHRGRRPTWRPAARVGEDSVTVLPWHGSADQSCLAETDCLIAFPATDQAYTAGDEVSVLPFE